MLGLRRCVLTAAAFLFVLTVAAVSGARSEQELDFDGDTPKRHRHRIVRPADEFKYAGGEDFNEDVDDSPEDSSSRASDDDFYRDLFGGTTTTAATSRSRQEDHPQSLNSPTPSYSPSRGRMSLGISKGLLEIRKANDHYLKVRQQARCKEPKPRVIKVKDFYPDVTKEFLPRCTVLHKCGDDAGCCDHETMQCVAKQQQIVELHFYTLHLSSLGGGVSSGNTVEKLGFVNDTECECQIVDDRPRFHVRKTRCLQCPAEYTAREYSNGICTCDCFDKQKACMKMKRGREPLPEADQRCVEAKRCQQPVCEYGYYDLTMGRCPRKNERRHHSNGGHHSGQGLWRIDERD